jgi:DtxR family Mn-dependent transcriptional regulator
VVRRHETLNDFFLKILLLEEDEAEEASCKIEHAISNKILDRIINFVEFVEICPRGGKEWIEGFRRHCEKGDTSARCADAISLCFEDLKKREIHILNSPPKTVSLEEMDPGQRGKILNIEQHSEIDNRLSGLGIHAGSIIEVEGRKSQDDHVEVKVRGYHLSLRKNEAAKIAVQLYE